MQAIRELTQVKMPIEKQTVTLIAMKIAEMKVVTTSQLKGPYLPLMRRKKKLNGNDFKRKSTSNVLINNIKIDLVTY